MNKKLVSTYILTLVFSAIIVAWATLVRYFSGVGVNFVLVAGVFVAILSIVLVDREVFHKTKDIFFATLPFLVLEFLVYFVFEFEIVSGKGIKFFLGFQAVLSFLAFLLFAYAAVRFILERKGVRFGFGSGNGYVKKEKKAKELSNGTLEDKPNNTYVEDELEEEEEPDIKTEE